MIFCNFFFLIKKMLKLTTSAELVQPQTSKSIYKNRVTQSNKLAKITELIPPPQNQCLILPSKN